jgi:hypothetical protein
MPMKIEPFASAKPTMVTKAIPETVKTWVAAICLCIISALRVFVLLRRFKSEVQQGSIDGMAE